MGFHRIPSLRLGNLIGSISYRFTPPKSPLFSGLFHYFQKTRFCRLTSDSQKNHVKNDVVISAGILRRISEECQWQYTATEDAGLRTPCLGPLKGAERYGVGKGRRDKDISVF